MANIKKLNINKLLLDISNPRFPNEVDSQREAIATMLNLPRMSQQIMKLAKDIAENGLDPSENLIVFESEDEPGFYIAAEGNRRLTVLKLLANPEIAPEEKYVNQFKKLKQISKNIILEVDCHVDEDNTYERWVELKHTGQNEGISRVGWTTLEQQHFLAKHGKESQQLQVFKFIESQSSDFEGIKKKKTDIKLTNLARLFGDSRVKIAFSLKLIDGYLYCEQPYSNFKASLKTLLDVMLERDADGKVMFTVNRIRSLDDRTNFIHEIGISPSSVKLLKPWKLIDTSMHKDVITSVNEGTVNDKSENKEEGNPANSSSSQDDNLNQDKSTHANNDTNDLGHTSNEKEQQTSSKNTPTPKPNRESLIPANVRLNFNGNKKCSRIFVELKSHLTYKSTINSVAVMLRVFVELSVSAYIEANKLKPKDPSRNPGLHDKVVMCAEHLRDNNKRLNQKQVSAILAYSKSSTASNGSLQQYVHNDSLFPSKDVLNAEWDNFEPLLSAIWQKD